MQFRGRTYPEIPEFAESKRSISRSSTPPLSESKMMSRSTIYLAVIFFSCFAVNSDLLMSAPNLTRISEDFRLSTSERDSHLGALIQFGFYLSAGIFSIIAGPVIELIDRSKLFGALTALSCILSCCSALVSIGRPGFFYFLLIRVSTGIPVGIMLPTAYSLLGDLVSVNQRTTMSAFVGTSCAAGAAVGQAIAGLSSGGLSWRVPYLVSSTFSAIACILSVWFLRDTRAFTAKRKRVHSPVSHNAAASAWRSTGHISRSQSIENTISMEDLNWARFSQVLRVNTNKLIFAQSFPGCIAWSSIATFLPDYIHKELKFSVKASTGVMAAFGISGLMFALIGSAIGQSIYNQDRKNLPMFVAICTAAGAVPMILLVLFGGNGFLTILFSSLGGIAAASGPNLKGMLMNANPSCDRGSVFAMFNLVENVGKGVGPSILVLITWLAGGSRGTAFSIAFGLWFVSAWISSQLENCLNEDTLAVEIKQEGQSQRAPFDLLHIYHN